MTDTVNSDTGQSTRAITTAGRFEASGGRDRPGALAGV